MKRALVTFTFILIAMLAIPGISRAETIKYYVTISDATCTPQPYTGKYIAEVWIEYNGNPICETQIPNLIGGGVPNLIQYDCDFIQVKEQIYTIHVIVCRQFLKHVVHQIHLGGQCYQVT